MENKPLELEDKYQKLATEYSKVRSQASVLKKAVLDEQAKNTELKDIIKKQEQTIRKHDQEMESLTFRNEQLTKRISVLQQELQANSAGKKNKNKNSESVANVDFSILDEELQKKIMENAQLVSTMADRNFELNDYKEKNKQLEMKIENLKKKLENSEYHYSENIKRLQNEKTVGDYQTKEPVGLTNDNDINVHTNFWKLEAEKWKTEYNLLHQKPNSNEKLTDYYEKQIHEILESRQMCQSETQTILDENLALCARLENLILENEILQSNLNKSTEELLITNENYKSQLDAMTEHLAAQNDKITKQCDDIQDLKMKIAMKK